MEDMVRSGIRAAVLWAYDSSEVGMREIALRLGDEWITPRDET
jgi:hypothetical protein